MPSASALRLELETALAPRIPSALTPAPRVVRAVASTGIAAIDLLLAGGLPLGAITELVGLEGSGRTSFALSFLAAMTQAGRVCAWVDVSNALSPESAAAAGVDLARLLWIRCGVPAVAPSAPFSSGAGFSLSEKCFSPPPGKKGLHGGGCGGHPRGAMKGMADALGSFLNPAAPAPPRAEPPHRMHREKGPLHREKNGCEPGLRSPQPSGSAQRILPVKPCSTKPWSRMDQALRATDLLLQAGGFGSLVLDLGSLPPEFSSRVPLATWFRYRAAAERTQCTVVLLTQHACAKSSAELMLQFQGGMMPALEQMEPRTVFTGSESSVHVGHQRFTQLTKILQKPVQRETSVRWRSRTAWAGRQ